MTFNTLFHEAIPYSKYRTFPLFPFLSLCSQPCPLPQATSALLFITVDYLHFLELYVNGRKHTPNGLCSWFPISSPYSVTQLFIF